MLLILVLVFLYVNDNNKGGEVGYSSSSYSNSIDPGVQNYVNRNMKFVSD